MTPASSAVLMYQHKTSKRIKQSAVKNYYNYYLSLSLYLNKSIEDHQWYNNQQEPRGSNTDDNHCTNNREECCEELTEGLRNDLINNINILRQHQMTSYCITHITFENLLRILPRGVVSKKDIGDRRIFLSIPS